MPLYLKDKKATLFKGDHKPVSLYLGEKKTTGYKYVNGAGEYLEFEGTYNDTANMIFYGKSEQEVTVQGKNLLDVTKFESAPVLDYNPTIQYVSLQLKLLPNENYTLSSNVPGAMGGSAEQNRHIYFNSTSSANAVFYQNPSTKITDSDGYISVNVMLDRLYSEDILNGVFWIQLEPGNIATEYEPFVPNSPSPDYPSPIHNVGDDGGFDLVSVGNAGQLQTIHIPYTLRSLPNGTSDYIKIDNAAKTAKLVRNVGVKVFSGSDIFNPYSNHTNTISRSIVISDAKGLSYNNDETRSDRLTRISNVSSDMEGYGNGDTTNRLFIRLNKSRLTGYEESWTSPQISSAVNAFFEAKNWIFYYKLATPTTTELDYNAVKTYYPYTQIYTTNSTVVPTLEVGVRVVDDIYGLFVL